MRNSDSHPEYDLPMNLDIDQQLQAGRTSTSQDDPIPQPLDRRNKIEIDVQTLRCCSNTSELHQTNFEHWLL